MSYFHLTKKLSNYSCLTYSCFFWTNFHLSGTFLPLKLAPIFNTALAASNLPLLINHLGLSGMKKNMSRTGKLAKDISNWIWKESNYNIQTYSRYRKTDVMIPLTSKVTKAPVWKIFHLCFNIVVSVNN